MGSGTITSYIKWTNEACSDSINNPYCSNCDTGGKSAVFLVLLACTTRLPSMMLLKARMNPISDIPLIKFLGMIAEALAALCLSGAMFIWREYCHVQLPAQGSMTYAYGTGFYMLALGFCMSTLLFVFHTLLPTEDPFDEVSLLDEHLACCSAKSRASKKGIEKEAKVKSSQVKPDEGIPVKKKRRKRKKQVAPSRESDIDRGTSDMVDLEKGDIS